MNQYFGCFDSFFGYLSFISSGSLVSVLLISKTHSSLLYSSFIGNLLLLHRSLRDTLLILPLSTNHDVANLIPSGNQ